MGTLSKQRRIFRLGMPQEELDQEGEVLRQAVCSFTGWQPTRVQTRIWLAPEGFSQFRINIEVLLDGQEPEGDDHVLLDRFLRLAKVNGRPNQIECHESNDSQSN